MSHGFGWRREEPRLHARLQAIIKPRATRASNLTRMNSKILRRADAIGGSAVAVGTERGDVVARSPNSLAPIAALQ